MSGVTPTYNWPIPDLTDTPNVPSDISDLTAAQEATVSDIDARARRDGKIIGRTASPGVTGDVLIALPFSPQLVTFTSQYTNPNASSGSAANLGIGRLGLQADGTPMQDLTSIRIISGNYERRTFFSYCAGMVIDDTTQSGLASGLITPAGFTLTFNDTSTTVTHFWIAYE